MGDTLKKFILAGSAVVLIGLVLSRSLFQKPMPAPESMPKVEASEPRVQTESPPLPQQMSKENPQPTPEKSSAPASDPKTDEVKAEVEKKVQAMIASYGTRLEASGHQWKCEPLNCDIQIRVDPKDTDLRAEILKKVGAILRETLKKHGALVKEANSNNIVPEIVSMSIDFYDNDGEAESMTSLLQPEAFQESAKENPSMDAKENLVQFILKAYQRDGQLVTIKSVRSVRESASLSKFYVEHYPNTTDLAAEGDVFLLAGMVTRSHEVLGHGFKHHSVQNNRKNGETWFTVKPRDP
jgi:hypothetical protein